MSFTKNKKTHTPTFAAGHGVFLEHMLPYAAMEEKGRMTEAPSVRLGGGAYNILKTLQALQVPRKNTLLVASVGAETSPHRHTLEHILGNDTVPAVLLPLRERVSSSYYLVPHNKPTWAFGDVGGAFQSLSRTHAKALTAASRAHVRIIAELGTGPNELSFADTFFNKQSPNQISVLIPSLKFLQDKNIKGRIEHVDVVTMNEVEAKEYFGRAPTHAVLKKSAVPVMLITRGGNLATLKVGDSIYESRPPRVKKALYPNGAGDAATAGLLYGLFVQKMTPMDALTLALTCGSRVMGVETAYLAD